jgi:hypothetical protein
MKTLEERVKYLEEAVDWLIGLLTEVKGDKDELGNV